MKQQTKSQYKKTQIEVKHLYMSVCALDNTENECDCENQQKYDFRNICPVEEGTILCLNCGGYIEYSEEDWL